MKIRDFRDYPDDASGDTEICVVARAIETGTEIAATYDVVVTISDFGEMTINIRI